jgi:hypothetical protein
LIQKALAKERKEAGEERRVPVVVLQEDVYAARDIVGVPAREEIRPRVVHVHEPLFQNFLFERQLFQSE